MTSLLHGNSALTLRPHFLHTLCCWSVPFVRIDYGGGHGAIPLLRSLLFALVVLAASYLFMQKLSLSQICFRKDGIQLCQTLLTFKLGLGVRGQVRDGLLPLSTIN